MPTHDAEELGQQLVRLDPRITAAKDHIEREFRATDGIAAAAYDGGGTSAGNPAEQSPVERVIIARAHLLEHMYQINDCLDAVEAINRELSKLCNKTLGTRISHTVGECYSSPQLDGYLVPLDEGGWFDATCRKPPRSIEGQCDACRKRMERYRAKTDQKPVTDERVVTYDSTVHYVNDVALARPIRGAA